MSEHLTRDERAFYDHESEASPRRRQADDWGIDESFPRVRSRRFARTQEGPGRSRRRTAQDWGADDAFGGQARRRSGHAPERPEPVGAPPAAEVAPAPPEPLVESDERRTIRINGRPGELSELAPFVSSAARRRPPQTVGERMAGDPTRIIALAFALGLLLILIAVATS